MPDSIHQMLAMARSGILARLVDLDTVSANLANVNTTGYKRNRLNFQEALSAAQPNGADVASTQWTMRAGAFQTTGEPLDLAIEGTGFFAVRLASGDTAYTRDWRFQRDASGQLVTTSGLPLIWDGQLPADATAVQITPDGTVMAQVDGVWAEAGQVQLHRFPNPTALLGYGQNLWLPSAASGAAEAGAAASAGWGKLQSGVLEASNVDLTTEMTQLTLLQRSYSMALQAFQQTDQMLGLAVKMRQG